jgi:hypothetical protein
VAGPAEEESRAKARSTEVILSAMNQQERRLSKRMDQLEQLMDAPRSGKGKGKRRSSSSQVSSHMQAWHLLAQIQ